MFVVFLCLCIFFIFKDFFLHFVEFLVWKSIDLFRYIKDRLQKKHRRYNLYGIWLFCGLYGQGKTMGLTEYLIRMRKKYGKNIYICTNYGFIDEDFPLTNWKDLLKEYDRPVIFGYDEIQNEFNSRDYKNFPYELVKLLTQNRKGNGKQIVGTAQRYMRVDKVIRELCTHVVECKTFAGRWTSTVKYDIEDYEDRINQTSVNRKMKIRGSRYSFIQTDKMRNSYDSFKMLDSARNKEYISAYEKANLE